ncbi:DUF2149 domain-containing protein [Vibrio mangrovi]|uniref:DUF2149 domain-containing protein n=1 Tax=Vibrio mangrovi TaxID=474394 RepID=A0A1Y6IWF1_9VIBR|nr:DUF2149 domain-containing protein [Vibrio mangrovi]MDW6002920.1 DUF2149 domain-containing protein [Vibrio mangrovi]SMS01160.1 hypothetical protein VIM7927_02440 [Vibrio mangrovi]
MMSQQQNKPRSSHRLWQGGRFHQEDTDPLSGFANIMDVMLVFALGLLIALISQNETLQQHFSLTDVEVTAQQELVELPDSMQGKGDARQGMENVGTVYRDAKTGKLILVGQ